MVVTTASRLLVRVQRADTRLALSVEPVTLEPDLAEHGQVGGVPEVTLLERATVGPCRHRRLGGGPLVEEQRQEPSAHGQHLSEDPQLHLRRRVLHRVWSRDQIDQVLEVLVHPLNQGYHLPSVQDGMGGLVVAVLGDERGLWRWLRVGATVMLGLWVAYWHWQPHGVGAVPMEAEHGTVVAHWDLGRPPVGAPSDLAGLPDGSWVAADALTRSVILVAETGEVAAEWQPDPRGCVQAMPRAVAVSRRSPEPTIYSVWDCAFGDALLERRLADGSLVHAVKLRAVGRDIGRMDVLSTDDVAVSSGKHVVFSSSTTGARMRRSIPIDEQRAEIAILPDDSLVILNRTQPSVEHRALDATRLATVDLAPYDPVALTVTAEGGVIILIAGVERGAPTALRLDDEWRSARWIPESASLMAPPTDVKWPWQVDAWSDTDLLMSSAQEAFRVMSTFRGSLATMDGARTDLRFLESDLRAVPLGLEVAIAPQPGGGLVALDRFTQTLIRVDRDDGAQRLAIAPEGAVDVTVSEENEVFVASLDGSVHRLNPAGGWERLYQGARSSSIGGRLSVLADGSRLYVSQPLEAAVVALSASSGDVLGRITSGTDAVWPTDLVVGGDSVWAASEAVGEVHGARPQDPDAPRQILPLSSAAGPRRLAYGKDDAGPRVGALTGHGTVELVRPVSPQERVVIDVPVAGDERLTDIAIAADGAVLVAEAERGEVWQVVPGERPSPEVTPTASPIPSPPQCTLRGSQRVQPQTVVRGEAVSVALSISADCPGGSRISGADVWLVLDTSTSMSEHWPASRWAAENLIARIDLRYHRVGIVAFNEYGQIIEPLGSDGRRALDTLNRLPCCVGGTAVAKGLQTALEGIREYGRPDAQPIVVVFSDEGTGGGLDPGASAAAARAAAADLKAIGVQIHGVAVGEGVNGALMRDIASGTSYYHRAADARGLLAAIRHVAGSVRTDLPGALVVQSQVGDTMGYMDGSSTPSAARLSGSVLQWRRSVLPADGFTVTYGVRTQEGGLWPVYEWSKAEYTDVDGQRRTYSFDEVYVTVLEPTPVAQPLVLPLLLQGADITERPQ